MLQPAALLFTILLALLALVGKLADDLSPERTGIGSGRSPNRAVQMPLPDALGQMVVARYRGPRPPDAFLNRIREGEIGGVILFTDNLGGEEHTIATRIGRLQRAAAIGGNPPLLVMVDQEGGKVRRLAGPPTTAPRRLSGRRDAREQGEVTADLLRRLGINVDLAPVADIAHPGSFLGSRAFGSSSEQVALRACAFADGLRHRGVVATLKHFPGLGLAGTSTDASSVTIGVPSVRIRADYAPYQACAGAPLTLVMVASAVYPHLTGNRPAVMSPGTYSRELTAAGARGAVTISDALETPSLEPYPDAARQAIVAGLDLLLYARSESTSAAGYALLLADARQGRISPHRVREGAAAVMELKRELSRSSRARRPLLPPASG